MELKHMLDLRNNIDLSELYVTVCYNARCALKEYIASLNPENYQRFRILNNFREDFLYYLRITERVDIGNLEDIIINSYDFICGITKNLMSLVDILKE